MHKIRIRYNLSEIDNPSAYTQVSEPMRCLVESALSERTGQSPLLQALLWNAWTEVWDGQFWHGLDPTHNRLADERYIKLSHGRDFMDAAVDRGCFLGKAGQEQTILIKVEEK